MTNPIDNIIPGQWLRNSILERYPRLLQDGSADLNHDGTVSKTEAFKGDIKNIDDVATYYFRNKEIIDENIPLARWATSMDGKHFNLFNPLFDYAYLSLKTVPQEDVKKTIDLAETIIADYREFGNPHASAKEMINALYVYLHDEGIAIGGTSLISDGAARGMMSRDAAAVFVMSMAYQLGLDIYSFPPPAPIEDGYDNFLCKLIGINPCPYYAPTAPPPPAMATLHYADGTVAELELARLFGLFYTAHASAEEQFGDLGNARRLYRTALAIDPHSLSLHYRLGEVLRRMGNYDEAIGLYTEMLVHHPDEQDARINRGLARLEKKDFAGAEEEFRKLIKDDPFNAPAHLHLARTLFLQGNRKEAIERCTEATKLNPRFALAFFHLGRMEHARRKRRAALNNYTKAYNLDRSLSDALYYKGMVYREWGNQALARRFFLKAIRNDRRNAKAKYFNAFGLLEQRRKNYKEAEWYFSQATKHDPQYAKGFANRGDVRHFYLRKYFAARKDYQRALKIDPNLMYARINLGFLLLHLKEPEEAFIHSSKAITIKPNNCEANFLHGRALFDYHQKITAAKTATKKPPSAKGTVKARIPKVNIPTAKNISQIRKPLLMALASFEKAITCSGKRIDPEYLFWRARAWFAKGNTAEALHDVSRAIEIDPKYAEAYLLRSDIRKASGDDWGAARDRTQGCSLKTSLCPTQLPTR